MTELGSRLRKWRATNRLSQRQTADVMARHGIPITVHMIKNLEHGLPTRQSVLLLQFLEAFPTLTDPPPRYSGYRPTRSESDKHAMRAMRNHGMSLAKIGEQFGITESGVSRILSGKTRKTQKKIRT